MSDKLVELEDFKKHFDAGYHDDILHFAKAVALSHSRYIFKEGQKNNCRGYCTHCQHEFEMPNLGHKTFYNCPSCKGYHEVRNARMGRKHFVDRQYFTYFEKSVLDPNILVARGIVALNDFRFDYRCTETRCVTKAYYLFEAGKGGQCIFNIWADEGYDWSSDIWCTANTIRDISRRSSHLGNVDMGVALESLKDAAIGTSFQYSAWEVYADKVKSKENLIDYLDLFAKYPCTEYLTKMGFTKIVETKIYGGKLFRLVNWRGKTIDQVIKLPKHRIKDIINRNIAVSLDLLLILRQLEHEGSRYTLYEALEIERLLYPVTEAEYFNSLFSDYMPLKKLYTYLCRQRAKDSRNGLLTYRDYLNECLELGLDLTQEIVLFPPNLYSAHEKTMNLIKIKNDEALKVKFAKRVQELPCDSNGRYLIRPAFDADELTKEGDALQHCVGGYANRYASGSCDLYVVRRVEEEDTPFVTVEMKGDRLIQARGFKNSSINKDVEEFIHQFIKNKLGGDVAKAV